MLEFLLAILLRGPVIPDPDGWYRDGLRIVQIDEFFDRAILPPKGYVLCVPAKYPELEWLWVRIRKPEKDMTGVEKAVFWIHGRKCRVLVFAANGQVMDNDDSWNNLASAQCDVFNRYGYGVVHEHVAGNDTKRIDELNAIFSARMTSVAGAE